LTIKVDQKNELLGDLKKNFFHEIENS